jgi:hypothetical protein
MVQRWQVSLEALQQSSFRFPVAIAHGTFHSNPEQTQGYIFGQAPRKFLVADPNLYLTLVGELIAKGSDRSRGAQVVKF